MSATTSNRPVDPGQTPRRAAVRSDRPSGHRPWIELARVVGLVVVVVVVLRMVGRLADVIGLVLLAGTVALLTDPLRRRLARHMAGGAAVALTALATIAVIAAIGGVLYADLAAQAERLSVGLADWIDGFRAGTLPARVAGALDARDGVDEVISRLPVNVVAGEDEVTGLGRQIVDILLTVILAAFFQSGASNAVDAVVSRWPREQRRGLRDLISDVERRGAALVRRTILLGAVVAASVALAAAASGVGGAMVVGAWAGVWSAVPVVGWIIGMGVAIGAAFSHGVVAGLVVSTVAVTVTVGVAIARRRLIRRTGVPLGAALSALALAAGISAAGLGGALVALVAVSLIVAAATSSSSFSLPVRNPDTDAIDADDRLDASHPPRGVDAIVRVVDGRVDLAPGWRGALTVVGAALGGLLVWTLAGRLGAVVIWFVVGAFIAVALSRPVASLQRRAHLPRLAAVGVVFVVVLVVIGAAGVAGLDGGASTGTELAEELPTIVTELEAVPVLGPWLEQRDASTWVSEQMNELPQRLDEVSDVSELLPTVGARVLDLFWTIVIALVLLIDGPRLVRAVEHRVPVRSRRQFARLVAVSDRAIGGYLAGAAIVATINASVIFVLALVLGVALAPVLALWGFIWNFVPQIGGFMGGFPLVVLALAVGPLHALVAGVVFLAYQLIENHLIQPAIIAEAIDVAPWVTLLAALAGAAAAGVVGAIVLTPLVGVTRVVILEIRRADFPGATAAAHATDAPGAHDVTVPQIVT